MTLCGMANNRVSAETARPVPRRPSIQSALTAGVTQVALRPISGAVPLNRAGVWFTRTLVATSMGIFGPPLRGTQVTPVREGAVVGEWVRAPGVRHSGRAVFYLHGSAYVICSARTHRGLASRLSRATGLPVFLPDYRLAPEHLFPAAADDVEAGYRWLLTQGFDATDIVVAGDSAGGHLAIDLVIDNARTRTAQPAAVVLFSPLIDLTFGLAAEQERQRKDPMITAKAARALVDLYTDGQPEDAPRLRLDLAGVAALPPVLVQAGGAEMLSADARYLQRIVEEAGGKCELEIWPGQMHVFQALPFLIPEAAHALRRAANFVSRALNNQDTFVKEQVS